MFWHIYDCRMNSTTIMSRKDATAETSTTLIGGLLAQSADSFDIRQMAEVLACAESAAYFTREMGTPKIFSSDLDLLTHAMKIRKANGLILEFGVASGRTLNHIASLTKQTVYGFDAFTGLPENWRPDFLKGRFAQSIPQLATNAELVIGLFEDTLPAFIKRIGSQPISLLHIDCDLYSSTRTVLKALDKNIVSGTVIVFDEYFNYPGWQAHEWKAFREFCRDRNVTYTYDSLVANHQQVCVCLNRSYWFRQKRKLQRRVERMLGK